MKQRLMTPVLLERFAQALYREERAPGTVEKCRVAERPDRHFGGGRAVEGEYAGSRTGAGHYQR